MVPKIKIPSKSITQGCRRIDEAIRYRPQQESIACRLQRGSAVVRGWSNYFRIAHNYSRVAGKLDHHAFWSSIQTICRKNDISTARAIGKYYKGKHIQLDENCKLARFVPTR